MKYLVLAMAYATLMMTACNISYPVPMCGASFCGCWEEVSLSYSTTIIDSFGEPIEGVELWCRGEDTPLSISNGEGRVAFAIETRKSPGCDFERCQNLRFEDPEHRYATLEQTVYVTGPVQLEDLQ